MLGVWGGHCSTDLFRLNPPWCLYGEQGQIQRAPPILGALIHDLKYVEGDFLLFSAFCSSESLLIEEA